MYDEKKQCNTEKREIVFLVKVERHSNFYKLFSVYEMTLHVCLTYIYTKYIHIHTHTHIYTNIHIYIHTHTHIYIYKYIYIYIFVSKRVKLLHCDFHVSIPKHQPHVYYCYYGNIDPLKLTGYLFYPNPELPRNLTKSFLHINLTS